MTSAVLSALSVLLCALAFILCSGPADAQADLALDCCLTVSSKSIHKQYIVSYRIQHRVDGCPRDAVVFKTRRGFQFCAPPASEAQWVEQMTKFVDNRYKKCKEAKFVGKRCEGLRT